MSPAWSWLIVGPLFLVGFAAFFATLAHPRARRRETHDRGGHVRIPPPTPYDWKRHL